VVEALTAAGRSSEYYAYYHCRPGCRAVNVTKAKLEGLFADELALLQPTPGYMRLLKESVLQIWNARKAAVREELATAERAAKVIEEKLGRLDEATATPRTARGALAFAERVLALPRHAYSTVGSGIGQTGTARRPQWGGRGCGWS
jgi:hypothetical protein